MSMIPFSPPRLSPTKGKRFPLISVIDFSLLRDLPFPSPPIRGRIFPGEEILFYWKGFIERDEGIIS